MGDQTKRPLKISPAYLPYLEKHRIYELFHEIAREMVIQQPPDHVMFMKQILVNAARSRDVPRAVIIASPRINSIEIALMISKQTQQIVITKNDILRVLHKTDSDELSADMLVKGLSVLIRTNNAYKVGWIVADCIKTEESANAMIQAGILPTHVLHIIPPFYPTFDKLLYCHVPTEFPEYRKKLLRLKHVFAKTLREIHVGDRGISGVVRECIELMKIRKGLAPIKPRVLILGPRGSGRKTQAKLLNSKLGLIHVDFEYLLCQMWISDTDVGVTIRNCKDEVCLHPELMVQVVNKRLLEEDCLTKGYVLTHYPYTEQDFRLLDTLDTPPNRVVFLEVDINVCRERIKNRRFNVYSGSKIDIRAEEIDEDSEEYIKHPKDATDVIDAEISYYCEQYGALRKYCGATANFINADQNEMRVNECILAVISRYPPSAPPRAGITEATETSVLMTEASDENRCCCIPLPSTIRDCYRNVFENKPKILAPSSEDNKLGHRNECNINNL